MTVAREARGAASATFNNATVRERWALTKRSPRRLHVCEEQKYRSGDLRKDERISHGDGLWPLRVNDRERVTHLRWMTMAAFVKAMPFGFVCGLRNVKSSNDERSHWKVAAQPARSAGDQLSARSGVAKSPSSHLETGGRCPPGRP